MKVTSQCWTVARDEREATARARANQFSFPSRFMANEAYGNSDLLRLGLHMFPVTLTIEVGEPVDAEKGGEP